MPSGIYAIVHKQSGKLYVGSAVDVKERWCFHRDEFRKDINSPHLQSAWNKYGADAFEFKILEEVNDKPKLIEREQFWMDKYESWNSEKGYNICRVAGSTLGIKCSEDKRKKISKSVKKTLQDPAIKQYMIQRIREGMSTEVAHKRLSEAMTGKSNCWKGKRRSADNCKRISDTLRGRTDSLGTRKKKQESRMRYLAGQQVSSEIQLSARI